MENAEQRRWKLNREKKVGAASSRASKALKKVIAEQGLDEVSM
jgi:hypothetical protein